MRWINFARLPLQLQGDAVNNPAARSLAAKLLVSSLQGSSNLRTDPNLSKQLIEEQLTKQGIPTIEVRKGDLITRKGEPISPQAYDVLDFSEKSSENPSPWFGLVVSSKPSLPAA